jgi:hypothetical protein
VNFFRYIVVLWYFCLLDEIGCTKYNLLFQIVFILSALERILGSVWLRSQVERSRSIPDSRNGAALFCVW